MSVEGFSWNERPQPAGLGSADTHALVALIQVSEFAAIRRALGIPRAELVVLDVAERIAALVPAAIVVTAGRNLIEFGLSATSADALDEAITTINHGFEQPVTIEGEQHRLHLVIGTATAPVREGDDIALIERAEQALSEALAAGPGVVTAAPIQSSDEDTSLAHDLKLAAVRDELFLHYQPKLHLRQQKIVSVEALMRWHHPNRGLVLPNDFIPLAERTGDIAAMTLWTIRQVIADQRVLRRNGHDLPVFINMAGALLSDAGFIDQAIAIITNSGAKLGMEITETSVIRDPAGAIAHLNRLAEIGVVITIDDYGAGLSSLAYLKQLPARELKIDKLFVTQLTSSHRDPLIVRSTIDLAHALEMEVVAEGVETQASLALLSVMGCDMVQGYLISRPIALEALLAFLRDDAHIALATAPRSPIERLAAVRARG